MTDTSILIARGPYDKSLSRRYRPRLVERLPKWAIFVPSIIQWFYLGLRYRSVTLPSCTNPHITAGGLVGDRKSEYFAQMGPHAAAFVSPHVTIEVNDTTDLATLLRAMDEAALVFPVMAKPDLGWCGFGVQHVADARALATYLDAFPRGARLMLQAFCPEPGEAGLFYLREPDAMRGRLLGVLLRYPPTVMGDGHATIEKLIRADPRLKRTVSNVHHECRYEPHRVPAAGEAVPLAFVGSTRVGGLYEDGSEHATPALLAVMDAIALDMPDFHAGRFDVRFTTLEALREGHFTIMEVNGAGSEAVHAWDPKYTFGQTYGQVFAKQRQLFALGARMRAQGHRPVAPWTLARYFLEQRSLIRRYPPSN